MALGELGQGSIVTLTSEDEAVKTLNNAYDLALRTSLKGRNWDFATTFAQLALNSSADNLSPYEYLYNLPSDFLEIQRVYNTNDVDIDYIRTKEGLYTDANPAYIQYTAFTEDYSKFDEDFIHLVAMTLAEMCASKIDGSTQKEDFLMKKNQKIEAIAASKSVGRTRKKVVITDSEYITKRI